MINLNLTQIDQNLNDGSFTHFVRLDEIFIGSAIESEKQVKLLKNFHVTRAINIKNESEVEFDEKKAIESAGIEYINFPISSPSELTLEKYQEFKNILEKNTGRVFIFCLSGNRVGAFISLYLALVCGHPKKRALEVGKKIGLTSQALIEQVCKVLEVA